MCLMSASAVTAAAITALTETAAKCLYIQVRNKVLRVILMSFYIAENTAPEQIADFGFFKGEIDPGVFLPAVPKGKGAAVYEEIKGTQELQAFFSYLEGLKNKDLEQVKNYCDLAQGCLHISQQGPNGAFCEQFVPLPLLVSDNVSTTSALCFVKYGIKDLVFTDHEFIEHGSSGSAVNFDDVRRSFQHGAGERADLFLARMELNLCATFDALEIYYAKYAERYDLTAKEFAAGKKGFFIDHENKNVWCSFNGHYACRLSFDQLLNQQGVKQISHTALMDYLAGGSYGSWSDPEDYNFLKYSDFLKQYVEALKPAVSEQGRQHIAQTEFNGDLGTIGADRIPIMYRAEAFADSAFQYAVQWMPLDSRPIIGMADGLVKAESFPQSLCTGLGSAPELKGAVYIPERWDRLNGGALCVEELVRRGAQLFDAEPLNKADQRSYARTGRIYEITKQSFGAMQASFNIFMPVYASRRDALLNKPLPLIQVNAIRTAANKLNPKYYAKIKSGGSLMQLPDYAEFTANGGMRIAQFSLRSLNEGQRQILIKHDLYASLQDAVMDQPLAADEKIKLLGLGKTKERSTAVEAEEHCRNTGRKGRC